MLTRRWPRPLVMTLLGGLLASLLIGCGGGGGGSSSSLFGRSYLFESGGQTFAISVDETGRFTAFAKDPNAAPNGAGGQGSVGSDGHFFGQSDSGAIQFTGTITSDGGSVNGTVQANGQNLFAFNGPATTARSATPSGLTGSYAGTSGPNTALLTIDATSHATLWANLNGLMGGGQLNLGSTGDLTSADGATVAQITKNGTAFTITITKLNGVDVNVQIASNQVSRAKWTFMVFINGANNLQEFGPLNVNQMEKVGSTSDVNIVVQWKQANCFDCGSPQWVGTRRYYIRKDNDTSTVNSQLVQDMGSSIDMGDWHELRNFIVWSQQHYPADHYAVVIWNHGAGWRPTKAAGDNRLRQFPRSVSIDDSTNNEIQIWELPQALDVTPRMDIVIFDASLMQMTEVAYEIRNMAQYVTGSEESPPGEGYVYDTFLSDLVANPNMSALQLGNDIVTKTLDNPVQNNQTQSNIDLSKMQGVANALDTFAGSLMNHKADSAAAMTAARQSAQSYAYPDNKDLWDYAERIKNGTAATDLKNAATNVQSALAAAITSERHGAGNANSHGLAVYVPVPSSYIATYANLALARNSAWDTWLQSQP